MRNILVAVGAVVALPTFASAQLLVAPEGSFLTGTGTTTLTWRDTEFHMQLIYDTSHFLNQGVVGPISIDRMRFRPANGIADPGGQVYAGDGSTFGVNISIGDSLNDWNTPSTTFASNRGTMQTVMTFGTVNVGPSTGGVPNEYTIDIPIPGGFIYDPTLGADLLIEIDAPTPSAPVPNFSTASSTTQACRRISSGTQAALTGSTSSFANVILFDISGGPGGISTIVPAISENYGSGCYPNISRTFCEEFAIADATLDLGTGITMIPDVPGAPSAYTVLPGAGAFVAPINGPLPTSSASGDDGITNNLDFSATFSFPFVGGSTGIVQTCTNGYAILSGGNTSGSDFSPSITDFTGSTSGTHAGTPRLAPVWYDFHAGRNTTTNAAAGLYFDVDTVNNKVLLTWLDIGEFATSTAGAAGFNFQVELSSDGTIEYRYGAMSPFTSTSRTKLVGFTPGAPTFDPASIDLSASMPFLSNAAEIAQTPLALSTDPPLLNSIANVTTDNVPAVPGAMINVISLTQINPGVDLAVIGMGGCNAYVDPSPAAVIQSTFLLGSGTLAFGLSVPNDPFLANLTVYSQSLAFDSGAPNTFGAISSNGVALTLGTVQ